MNKFQEHILQMLQYGSIVDFVDSPGGTMSEAGSGGSSGADTVDTVETITPDDTGGNDTPGDDNTADDTTVDTADDTSSDDAAADDTAVYTTNNTDERLTALAGEISTLVEALKGSPNSDYEGGEGDGFDISSLEHEDLVAMMADDPRGFIDNLTAVIHSQVSQGVREETATSQYNSQVENTIDQYAEDNKDFESMWDEGKLQAFMEKNPGHNAISAHMAITMNRRVADAKKEGAEKAAKDFGTKSNNQVLNGGTSVSPEQRDAALKNPEKFGGRAAVLAARAGIT